VARGLQWTGWRTLMTVGNGVPAETTDVPSSVAHASGGDKRLFGQAHGRYRSETGAFPGAICARRPAICRRSPAVRVRGCFAKDGDYRHRKTERWCAQGWQGRR